MNQANTPESILPKVNEFLRSGDSENAMLIINDFINSPRKKIWTTSMETLILQFIELSINNNNIKYLREALNFYRNLSQNINLDSLQEVLTKTKELVEQKFFQALKSFQGVKIEITDLESDEKADFLFGSAAESKEKEVLVASQKFIWETYKILLDITKTNAKLFQLYSQILKAVFTFCRENKRTIEFKRLCDSVRNYLQTLIKSEKRQNFVNKVQITNTDVLKILIQMRLNQIDTATELEQWSEAFKTAEDIVYLFDKFEKHALEAERARRKEEKEAAAKDPTAKEGGKDDKTKQKKIQTKVNPLFKLEFYSNIEKLFWISNYPLYHSYAILMVRDIGNKSVSGFGDKAAEKLGKFKLETTGERIVLSTLATPMKNAYTNYMKIGEDVYEQPKDTEIETLKRMMSILKLNFVPSRNQLMNYINNHQLILECGELTKELYSLFQEEKNPIKICRKGPIILKDLAEYENKIYEKYIERLKFNLITKILVLLSENYNSISLERMTKLLAPFGLDEIAVEDIIIEVSRNGMIKCKLDHGENMILFVTLDSKTEAMNTNVSNFLFSAKKVIEEVSLKQNPEKMKLIREKLYEEVIVSHNNGLKTTEEILTQIKQKGEELRKFRADKNNKKFDLREKTQEDKEKMRLAKLERERLEKEELKSAQKKKEYDIQVKKYVIEILRKYTNSIIVNKKRIKLDDLLKDLSKVSEEEIIKSLEEQENDFKFKKEKKLKQISTNADYLLREFRKHDLEVYKKKLEEEEKEFNKNLQEQSKKYYEEKIGMKESLKKFREYKQAYFEKIKKEKVDQYNKELSDFKEKLKKTVDTDVYNELKAAFTKYFEDFKKREAEEKSKNISSHWSRGSMASYGNKNFERSQNAQEARGSRFQQPPVEFNRGGNFKKEENDFKRGALADEYGKNFKTDKSNTTTKIEFERSAKAQEPKKETGFNRGGKSDNDGFNRGGRADNDGFNRGSKAQEPKKDTGFNRGGKSDNDGFNRGSKAQEPKKDTGFNRGGKSDNDGFNRSSKAAPAKKK